MMAFDRKPIPWHMTMYRAISKSIRWLNSLLITLAITIRMLTTVQAYVAKICN
jgi:hypothetical protein